MENFIPAKLKIVTWETLSAISEDCCQEVRWGHRGGDFGEERKCVTQASTDVLVNGLGTFVGMGRGKNPGSYNSSPENICYLRPGSASSPRAQGASSWPSSWLPFRVQWRSATAEAKDVIPLELDGGQHSLVCNPFPFDFDLNRGLGGLSGLICPKALWMPISRSGEGFVERLCWQQPKACGPPALLICYGPGNMVQQPLAASSLV